MFSYQRLLFPRVGVGVAGKRKQMFFELIFLSLLVGKHFSCVLLCTFVDFVGNTHKWHVQAGALIPLGA